jgi:UDP-glucose 4-epimerase
MNRRTHYKPKTILIAGGAGYIGSHVNKKLHQHGYSTVVIDNLTRGHQKSACYGKFFQGDIGNAKDLEEIFQKHQFEGIMHFAAHLDVGESVINPYHYYHNNVCNTLNLLHFAVKHTIKAFVFSSSAAIFGLPEKESIDESHPQKPINPYGQTKLMMETIFNDFDRAYGLKSCCLRYFNAAGADPEGEIRLYPRKENNLIPRLLNSIKDPNHTFTLYGTDYPTADGTCIRDYIHVNDLADAHVKGLERLFATSTSCAYNLGNGRGFSVKEVIRAVEKVTGRRLQVVEGKRRDGDPPILISNSARAKYDLKWTPVFPELEAMIAHAHAAME